MKQLTLKMYIGALIIAIVFFLIGLKVGGYENKKTDQSSFGGRFGNGAGMMGGTMRGGMRGGGFTSGTIVSSDDKSVTISIPNGGSKTIYISDTTTVAKSTAGKKSDLTTGSTITVTGQANQDGSIAAQSIQIRPDIQTPATPPKAQ
jgi:hypothetical protein